MPARLVVIDGVAKSVANAITREAFVRIEEIISRASGQRLPTKRRLLVQAKPSIEATEFVVLIDEASIGSEETYERIRFAYVTFEAQDSNVGILVNKPFVTAYRGRINFLSIETGVQFTSFVRAEVSRTIVAGKYQSKGIAADLACGLHRKIRVNDCSRMNCLNLSLKDIDTFKEERTLLREEDWK